MLISLPQWVKQKWEFPRHNLKHKLLITMGTNEQISKQWDILGFGWDIVLSWVPSLTGMTGFTMIEVTPFV